MMKVREDGQKFVYNPLFAVIVRILFSSLITVKHATLQSICCMFVNDQCFVRMSCLCWLLDGVLSFFIYLTLKCNEKMKTILPSLCALNSLSCRIPCITNKPVLDKVTQTYRFTHVR